MKKVLSFVFVGLLVLALLLSSVADASTIYLPTNSSSQYLPTVKILSYSYNGTVYPDAYGSGTLIDNKGTILTNNHVIQSLYDPALANDAFEICLTRSNDTEDPVCKFTASVLARDTDRDLALLRIDPKDVSGDSLDFNFYLPYENSEVPQVSDEITVMGYPDTGGRTITYTSGLVSGFLVMNGIKFIKTDADISFGNSGGTAVDADGNFIGIPNYVQGSYSTETLGYLFPVSDAVSWIKENISNDLVSNEAAKAELKNQILKYVVANESGTYKNDYPPYEVSLIDGWEFKNSLEGAFDANSYGGYYGTAGVVLAPKVVSASSLLYVELSTTDYAYEVTLEDIEYNLGSYVSDVQTADMAIPTVERVSFNDKYSAVKDTYTYMDWVTGGNAYIVTYYIPYGNKVINVLYSYTDSDLDKLPEVDEILATFNVDMDKITFKTVNSVESTDPSIKVANPLADAYLADGSYDYDNVHYFGAYFGKKMDYSFYVSVYSNVYLDDTYNDDFAKFKDNTLTDAESWNDIVSKGSLKIDGHDGFYYKSEYDDGYGYVSDTVMVYIDNGNDSYFTVSYSAEPESFTKNTADFKKILKAIKLDNGGTGKYTIPTFAGVAGGVLQDIKNYVYEDNIKNLNKVGTFGKEAPAKFDPAGKLTRKDFVLWAVKSLTGNSLTEFQTFEAAYSGCTIDCFADLDVASEDYMYIDFARSKGAVIGSLVKEKYYLKPDDQISLMAAFKILFELYDYEVWQAPDFIPWYIPYLQLGYKQDLLPYGVDDVNYLLTRGEGAYMIDKVSTTAACGGYCYDPNSYYVY